MIKRPIAQTRKDVFNPILRVNPKQQENPLSHGVDNPDPHKCDIAL